VTTRTLRIAAALVLSGLLASSTLSAQAPLQPAASDPVSRAERANDLQDPTSALELLAPHLRRSPKDARALLARSTAHCLLGALDECKADLEAALRIDPTLRPGWLNRSAIAIAEGRFDDAHAALVEAQKLDPSAPDNAINLGAVELLRGRLESATAQFRRHLESQPDSADAWYLVASNYAHAGYAALALQHLERAIELDERSRVRSRTDANFADLATHRDYIRLLSTDGFVPAPGSLIAEHDFPTRYGGAESPIVVAILNTLQLSRAPIDPRVEITADWALLWSDFRIKVVANPDDTTTLRVSAPPGRFSAAAWQSRTTAFFQSIEGQLLRLDLAAAQAPPAS